jgi:hypothetical protein
MAGFRASPDAGVLGGWFRIVLMDADSGFLAGFAPMTRVTDYGYGY